MTASRSLRALSLIAIVALASVDMVACVTYDGQTGYLGRANRDTASGRDKKARGRRRYSGGSTGVNRYRPGMRGRGLLQTADEVVENGDVPKDCVTILEIIDSHPDLTELSSAIADLPVVRDALDADNETDTFFAPSNDAIDGFTSWAGFNDTKAGLQELLGDTEWKAYIVAYHAVPDEMYTIDKLESLEAGDRFLEDALEAEMPLLYVPKEYKVVGMGSAANIVGKNIYACNGVLHIIDAVLLPFDATLLPGDGKLSRAQKQRLLDAKEALDARYPDRPTSINPDEYDDEIEDEMTEVEESPALYPCAEAEPQSPRDVTPGFVGEKPSRLPPSSIVTRVDTMALVNVHFHLGAEHRSEGEYDTTKPSNDTEARRRLRRLLDSGDPALPLETHGYYCDQSPGYVEKRDAGGLGEYAFEHCENVEVGQTYEVHWVYSTGAAAEESERLTPGLGGAMSTQVNPTVAVRAQVFYVTTDRGDELEGLAFSGWRSEMIGDGDAAYYSGSTTGRKYDNDASCSPVQVSWNVDRRCRAVSAASLDAMCAAMRERSMGADAASQGSRDLVTEALSATEAYDMTREQIDAN